MNTLKKLENPTGKFKWHDNYRDYAQSFLAKARGLRMIPPTQDDYKKVKKVAVILTGSRNGSSLMKTVISKSNDVAYLSGEEEPFYALAGNTFPFGSDHDGFTDMKGAGQFLRDNILDEMGVNTPEPDMEDIVHYWRNRLPLQCECDATFLNQAEDILRSVFRGCEDGGYTYQEKTQIFLREIFYGRQTLGYYDAIPENTPFLISDVDGFKIEEPPYVIPEPRRRLNKQDLEDKTFIFKTPQDCYRIGLFEKLFPNAKIKYIHLTRGFAQAVNGLMDGWLSETGFFAHNMHIVDQTLDIKGYTDKIRGGDRWWKFDLPPNWESYTRTTLEEVCLNQWFSAHSAILDSGVEAKQIKFEDFLNNPQREINEITDYLEIDRVKVKKLPVIMATEAPSEYRWKKREELITELASDVRVVTMMTKLNYSMNSETWR